MVSTGQEDPTSPPPPGGGGGGFTSAMAPSPAKREDSTSRGTRRRRRLIGVSTKMYFSAARTEAFIRGVVGLLSSSTLTLDDVDVFVIPDFVTITSVIAAVRSAPEGSMAGRVLVGAQDCYSEDYGPFTGEVSPAVLAEVGVRLVELGHAERKRLFGETDGRVNEKVRGVVRNGMVPLICVGELRNDGGVERAVEEVIKQVRVVLEGIGDEAEVVLAYEPVWAIGASEPAGVEHVKGVVRGLRGWKGVRDRGDRVRVIYGGAAGRGLWERLGGEVDGLFLGRFGHDAGEFVKMVREVGGLGGPGAEG
ncbi:putative Triosephosphate isomerase [Triangularia verruculosa]|uniref:Triosephosphate isomerase n=1 Tax=Triangularia verruculosa TaxID=2587418 RepID=A0AAN6XJB2_9PEZI|nr:putative Triosephosphate isomerase [Triangularia verruculosa]